MPESILQMGWPTQTISTRPIAPSSSYAKSQAMARSTHFFWLITSYNSTRLSYMEDIHARAFFRPAESAGVYLSRALSGRRKDMRQQANNWPG